MGLHRCADAECTYFGKPTDRGCACHISDESVLRQYLSDLAIAMEDAIRLLDDCEISHPLQWETALERAKRATA